MANSKVCALSLMVMAYVLFAPTPHPVGAAVAASVSVTDSPVASASSFASKVITCLLVLPSPVRVSASVSPEKLDVVAPVVERA